MMADDAARIRAAAIAELKATMAGGSDPLSITLAERRAGMDHLGLANPPAPDIAVRQTVLAGMGALVVSAPGAGPGILLHVHGGGYVAGAPRHYTGMLGELARETSRTAISFDYRLAPEFPFPAAIDDALAVYRECLAENDDIVLLGDSAGGGLALAMLLRARAAGLSLPRALVLLSPWTDLTGTSPALVSKAADDPMIDPRLIKLLASQYLGDADPSDPHASPALADYDAMPPMLIQVGSCEVLLDDALAVDAAARRSGVSVTLEIWPEMVHVWQIFLEALPQARDAIIRIGAWLNERAPRRLSDTQAN